jgi:predicted RNase H-like nuclease (RuvC/YqgF family)
LVLLTTGGDADILLHPNNNGDVGIGCNDPSAKLEVNGNIRAESVEIVEDITADYVFTKDYLLRPIQEVEQFVKTHKHLPDVPSADEFKKNGYTVHEMDELLLKKVEELTLYTIEQNKQIETLKEQNKALQQENQAIKEKNRKIDELERRLRKLEEE